MYIYIYIVCIYLLCIYIYVYIYIFIYICFKNYFTAMSTTESRNYSAKLILIRVYTSL